jgi:oligopeptide/dipeptide ABC transporter ATP-binding protein
VNARRPVEGPTPQARPTGQRPAALLELRDLTVTFRRGQSEVRAVNGLSYRVEAGQVTAIIGESGSGKTVSSRAVMGLLPASATVTGSARLDDTELIGLSPRAMRRYRGSDIAMVFQDPGRSLNPVIRVGDQITEAIRAHLPLSRQQARERAVELLGLVRLSAPAHRFHEYPHQLSGGMRQRVMIALALSAGPRLLIADEATTALDVTTQAQIMDLLMDLKSQLGMGLVMISHDLSLAAAYADDVIVMYAGQLVEQAATPALFAQVRMPYTRALLQAVPRLERESHQMLPPVPGRPPDPSGRRGGCPFEPRCPDARPRCASEAPPVTEDADGHRWACWYPCGKEEAGD